jgi:CubicO group peptidase (beta-lactamase class C family)
MAEDAYSDQIKAEIEKTFPDPNGPGVAVLVIDNGQKIFEWSHGMADVDKKVPITSDTLFQLASVSKPMTTLAIMILAERGKLDYKDLIIKYLPEMKKYGGQVTIENLMEHTSGLADNSDMYDSGVSPTPKEVMDLAENAAQLTFPTGSKYEYNNTNYVLLAQIVARVSGVDFAQFMKDNIFTPLGMNNTFVEIAGKQHFPNSAIGYYKQDKEGVYGNTDKEAYNLTYGDVNVYSTLNDMYKFDQGLQNDKLVSRATLDNAYTQTILNDGSKTGYGYGWSVTNVKGEKGVYHGGYWTGYNTMLYRFPDIGVTIIELSNADWFEVYNLQEKIMEIYGY